MPIKSDNSTKTREKMAVNSFLEFEKCSSNFRPIITPIPIIAAI